MSSRKRATEALCDEFRMYFVKLLEIIFRYNTGSLMNVTDR